MGSKLGFGDLLSQLKIAEKEFLKEGIQLAKTEFNENFDLKEDKGDEKGGAETWEPLKYRREPPPILQLTGNMRDKTVSAPIQYGSNFAFFIIDPLDKKGRGYASYHDTGTNKMPARRTVVQSSELDFKQLNALMNILDRVFNKQGYFS